MSDDWLEVNRKPTGFGGRLTIFWNNRNNTALIKIRNRQSESHLRVSWMRVQWPLWPPDPRWCRTRTGQSSVWRCPASSLRITSGDCLDLPRHERRKIFQLANNFDDSSLTLIISHNYLNVALSGSLIIIRCNEKHVYHVAWLNNPWQSITLRFCIVCWPS